MQTADVGAREIHILRGRWAVNAGLRALIATSEYVQRQRHLQILSGGPKRVVITAQVGPLRWSAAVDHPTLESRRGASLQFLGAGANVFQRDQRDAMQAPLIVRAKPGQPIVVNSEAGLLEFSIGQSEKCHPERGIKHLGLDTID